ncbi:Zn-ribbon domain-containing OB-fold protein [Paraburkholderia flagellata]|uniref:Zn-ribbon domain-containing OB-fold protein n=1 Tax=Paraburkholderia flagellata TaxID=2883241 RepID=UPI001F3B5BE5|nr:OB-fold domain-containing protein [Paraburkholderia flagellata]
MNGFRHLGTASVVRGRDGWSLLGAKCADCEAPIYPVLTVCPQCGGRGFIAAPLPAIGTLYCYSVVHMGPKGVDTPYTVGYVDLSDGLRVFGRIEMAAGVVQPGQQLELRVEPANQQASRFIYFFTAPGEISGQANS